MKTQINLALEMNHDVYVGENDDFDEVVLLLHGYQLDGYFMFKRFKKRFGNNVKVIAPNAPFPVPLKTDDGWEPRYGWYFYDPAKKNFYVNYEPAAKWLAQLAAKLNPLGKKTTIIGYSQGGYLAPKAAELIPECRKVLGINSIFRSSRFEVRSDIDYLQINGEQDDIVNPREAQEEFEAMQAKGAKGNFVLSQASHPLTRDLLNEAMELI